MKAICLYLFSQFNCKNILSLLNNFSPFSKQFIILWTIALWKWCYLPYKTLRLKFHSKPPFDFAKARHTIANTAVSIFDIHRNFKKWINQLNLPVSTVEFVWIVRYRILYGTASKSFYFIYGFEGKLETFTVLFGYSSCFISKLLFCCRSLFFFRNFYNILNTVLS